MVTIELGLTVYCYSVSIAMDICSIQPNQLYGLSYSVSTSWTHQNDTLEENKVKLNYMKLKKESARAK